MNLYIVVAVYLAVAGTGIGVFLWGKPDGNSLFDRVYRLVCVRFPWALKTALRKCCGKRAPEALDAAWEYVCFTSNPLVQISYLLVVVGGYLTFVTYGYSHLPNNYVGSWHKYSGFAVFTTCLSVWWRASSLDPGTVTPENAEDLCKVWDWDDQIFASALCKTCNTIKPARSKHCGLCNVCVARFDHHCIWINNCVGIGNHKWFLAFLFWHLVICFYGVGIGVVIICDITVSKELFSAVFVDPVTQERHPASYVIIAQYLLATEAMLFFVTALAALMGLVLCGFFLWHLNLVRTGTTTNEISKWKYLKYCLKQQGDEGKEKIKKLCNMYNLGIISNFREVFFPMNVHTLCIDNDEQSGQKGSSENERVDGRKQKRA